MAVSMEAGRQCQTPALASPQTWESSTNPLEPLFSVDAQDSMQGVGWPEAQKARGPGLDTDALFVHVSSWWLGHREQLVAESQRRKPLKALFLVFPGRIFMVPASQGHWEDAVHTCRTHRVIPLALGQLLGEKPNPCSLEQRDR